MADLELLVMKDDYIIKVIGKNGESHSNVDVDIGLKHKYHNSNIKAIHRTDEQGRIYLGKLNNITSVKANIIEKLQTAQPNTKVWELKTETTGHYNDIIGLSDDKLNIHYCNAPLQTYRVLQFSSYGNNLVAIHKDCLSKSDDTTICIQGLKSGRYLLVNVDSDYATSFRLVKGQRISDFGLIYSPETNQIYENPFHNQDICEIDQVNIQTGLKLALRQWDQSTSIQILSLPYYSA